METDDRGPHVDSREVHSLIYNTNTLYRYSIVRRRITRSEECARRDEVYPGDERGDKFHGTPEDTSSEANLCGVCSSVDMSRPWDDDFWPGIVEDRRHICVDWTVGLWYLGVDTRAVFSEDSVVPMYAPE